MKPRAAVFDAPTERTFQLLLDGACAVRRSERPMITNISTPADHALPVVAARFRALSRWVHERSCLRHRQVRRVVIRKRAAIR
jgi:hypothetical protein